MKRFMCAILILVCGTVCLSFLRSADAQTTTTTSTTSVTYTYPDGSTRDQSTVPTWFLPVPASIINFDTTLQPSGLSDPARVAQIVQSHRIAQQQVRLALNYLISNADNILAGRDSLYNEYFGNFYNTDSTANPFLGTYDRTVTAGVLDGNPIRAVNSPRYAPLVINQATEGSYSITVEYDGDGGYTTSGSTGNNNNTTNTTTTTLPSPLERVLRVGQKVFVGNPLTGGEIHTIAQIVDDTEILFFEPLQQDIKDTNITVSTGTVQQNFLFYVTSMEDRPNPTHYNQVVNTFAAIRDLLDESVTYHGAFSNSEHNQVFADDSAIFTELGDLTSLLGRNADRALRQAGYSNSGSPDHLANLALRNDITNTNPPDPLLWTADNDERLDDSGVGLGDLSRYFFGDQLTIYAGHSGNNNNEAVDPSNQYVGPSFVTELQNLVGDFLDGDTISTSQNVPTELRQWQMILQSFAEHSLDFTQTDVAAVGVMDLQNALFPGGSNLFLENRDASNFARFADLFKDAAAGGEITPFVLEPFGKRVYSQFAPIVPEGAFSTTDLTSAAAQTGQVTYRPNLNTTPVTPVPVIISN